MTTIAYKSGIMAGDKLCSWGTTPVPTTKVFIHEGMMVGMSGDKDNVQMFKDWILAGRPVEKPSFKTDAFSAIVVVNGETYQYNQGCIPHLIAKPYWAAGSGADYALGAMAHGASAAEAVEIASALDINTGLGVDIISLNMRSEPVGDEYGRQPHKSLGDCRTPLTNATASQLKNLDCVGVTGGVGKIAGEVSK